MISEMKEFSGLKSHFEQLEEFCLKNRGKTMPWANDKNLLRQYLEFCHFTGRVAVLLNGERINTVVFWWLDNFERIEAKHVNGMSQFEWRPMNRNADSIFISDVIGCHEGVKRLVANTVLINKKMMELPKYTYRHGKLLKISNKLFTRAIFGKQ